MNTVWINSTQNLGAKAARKSGEWIILTRMQCKRIDAGGTQNANRSATFH